MRLNKIIEQTLRDYPETRSSDKQLIVKIWQTYGLDLSESQIYKFYSLPSTESIRRLRQKIQEKGQYQADEKVKKVRRFKSYQVQQNAPSAKPERLEQILEEPAVHVQLEM